MPEQLIRVPFDRLDAVLRGVLATSRLTGRAATCARLFAEASRDGVPSHGLNRVKGFVRDIRSGSIDAAAEPVLVTAAGALEQWDGLLGPGPLNARFSMGRAIELAREHGMGCVALRRTNHWMRAGTYGWQAADAGMMGICWTNTIAVMPPWGSPDRRLGNNPLVVAAPRPPGHLVLDMALSQFSFGRLGTHLRAGEATPVPGGYDASGSLSTDPAAVMQGGRPLPVGFWKGAGLALMLDLFAAALSGGLATFQVTAQGRETSICQVFLCFDPARIGGQETVARLADAILADLLTAAPLQAGQPILYPGERALNARRDSLAHGVPVHENTWKEVCAM